MEHVGVFSRPDSPYWWLWLETAPHGEEREKTAIKIGGTTADRTDSRRLAEAHYAQRMRELAARIHRLPTAKAAIRFAKYAETYRDDVIAHHKGAEREREMLKTLMDFFGDDLLGAIDRDRARSYLTARRRSGVSARTVNREVDLLKAMLRDAVPKYLEASPIAGMKRLPVITPKRRLMSLSEERRLLKAAHDPQDRALLILGLDTLLRIGDLLDLRREDQSGQWLHIPDPKSGEAFEVPLSSRAARALRAIKHEYSHFFVKFRQAEKPRDWRSSVRQRLKRLCRDAHVPFGKTENGMRFHWATRRTGATRLLVKKRVPIPVVQRLGNWKTPDVLLQIYAEADRDDLLMAVGQPLPNRSRSTRKRA